VLCWRSVFERCEVPSLSAIAGREVRERAAEPREEKERRSKN
jgi:hypothetical protein